MCQLLSIYVTPYRHCNEYISIESDPGTNTVPIHLTVPRDLGSPVLALINEAARTSAAETPEG